MYQCHLFCKCIQTSIASIGITLKQNISKYFNALVKQKVLALTTCVEIVLYEHPHPFVLLFFLDELSICSAVDQDYPCISIYIYFVNKSLLILNNSVWV